MKYNDYSKKYVDKVQKDLVNKFDSIGSKLTSYAKSKLGVSNQGGKNPSKPGEFPHAGTGLLRANVTWVADRDSMGAFLKIGVAPIIDYAVFLEKGTHKMDARPFLYPTVWMNRQRIITWMRG